MNANCSQNINHNRWNEYDCLSLLCGLIHAKLNLWFRNTLHNFCCVIITKLMFLQKMFLQISSKFACMITLWTGPRFCLRSSVLSFDVSLHVSFSMGRVSCMGIVYSLSLFFRMNKSMKSHSFYCCKWCATYVTKYVLLTFYDKSEKKKVNRSTSSTESLLSLCCTTRWNFNPSKSLYVLSHFSHE